MVQDSNKPERPRVEPEIIPPAQTRPNRHQQARHPFFSSAADETHRIYVARLGLFGIALLMLILGVVVAVILLALVGAFLIWVPVVALLVAVGAILRLLRR